MGFIDSRVPAVAKVTFYPIDGAPIKRVYQTPKKRRGSWIPVGKLFILTEDDKIQTDDALAGRCCVSGTYEPVLNALVKLGVITLKDAVHHMTIEKATEHARDWRHKHMCAMKALEALGLELTLPQLRSINRETTKRDRTVAYLMEALNG